MEFSTCEELERINKQLMKRAARMGRGDLLTLAEIEAISGHDRYTGKWKQVIVKFRKAMLKDRGIALRAMTNDGYKFCTEDEQLRWCARNRQSRATRQLTRGVREVSALDASRLSDHQQRLRALTVEGLRRERRAVLRGLREQSAEVRKTEGLPHPRRAATA